MTAAGFRKSRDETLFSFFTSLTLALLAAYQAINFTLSFYRLVQAPVDQHRIETSGGHQSYLPKNTGWITSGLLIGATETIVGLAQNGFRGALTRRILRLLSRALFIIGLVKE